MVSRYIQRLQAERALEPGHDTKFVCTCVEVPQRGGEACTAQRAEAIATAIQNSQIRQLKVRQDVQITTGKIKNCEDPPLLPRPRIEHRHYLGRLPCSEKDPVGLIYRGGIAALLQC